MTGTLYIISAPSGTGKTSLVRALILSTPNLKFSVSYTTRQRREGEQDGIDYHFVSQTQFEKMIAEGDFLEHANVFGNYYGTSARVTQKDLEKGLDVILEIDWQGAQQVRQSSFSAVSIFILPPSKSVLRRRILDRKKDNITVIENRLKAAVDEVRHCREYDYLVVNDRFDEAVEQLRTIVQAERCKLVHQASPLKQLIEELLRAD